MLLLALSLMLDEVRDDALRVRPAVDVVAQKNQAIRRLERQAGQHASQLIQAAVNVADHKGTHSVSILGYSYLQFKLLGRLRVKLTFTAGFAIRRLDYEAA